MQLSCYAMYAMQKWGIDPVNVKLIEYNLLVNQGVEFTFGKSKIANTKSYIAGSIADMQSQLVDVGENIPKEEEAFQKVEDERVRAGCNFGRFVTIDSAIQKNKLNYAEDHCIANRVLWLQLKIV